MTLAKHRVFFVAARVHVCDQIQDLLARQLAQQTFWHNRDGRLETLVDHRLIDRHRLVLGERIDDDIYCCGCFVNNHAGDDLPRVEQPFLECIEPKPRRIVGSDRVDNRLFWNYGRRARTNAGSSRE